MDDKYFNLSFKKNWRKNMNKKIILSLFLVLLVAISVSTVAAADDAAAADAEPISADIDEVALTAEDEGANVGETTGTTIEVTEETPEAIQSAIDSANDGDTISLKENGVYDVGSTNFQILKNVTIKGNNATINVDGAGQGGQGGTFVTAAAGISFDGINFVNTNGHKNYGEAISGVAIKLTIKNSVINNCKFLDFKSGVDGSKAGFCTISNCYFNGSSTKVTNGGTKESGTKAIGLMTCNDIDVIDCIFEGQILDGVSIASGSSNIMIKGCQFIDNVYSIYFGGASTIGCSILENQFIRCGYCLDANGNILFKDTPVISTQKAANGYSVKDNTIVATDGSIFIKAESGNTAHGYPSQIGDINITGNTLTADEGANPETITFAYILSNKGPLNPYAPIVITGNTLEAGVTPVTVWYADWGSPANGAVIPAVDPASTFINVKQVASADGKITIELLDTNGAPVSGATVTYTVNGGEEQILTTDEDGIAIADITEDGTVSFAYAGDDKHKESASSVNYVSTALPKIATVIVAPNLETTAFDYNIDSRIGKFFEVTLKDEEGNLLTDKKVQIGFNGVIYNKTTDENGVAKLQINLGNKGEYTFAIYFAEDEKYNSSFVVAKITVKKQTPKLTAPAKTFSASAKTKTLTATLKTASGNALANKKVTFTVNGKTYTATTNNKGVATVKVSLNKKGTYTATVKYAGDTNRYDAVTSTAKVVIK